MQYTFTNDWFEAHKPTWRSILTRKLPTNILEIGSYEGQSTVYSSSLVLESQARPVSITCIDTWQGGREHSRDDMRSVEERFDRNTSLLKDKYSSRLNIRKIKSKSCTALSKLYLTGEDKSYDFIYIDGSHDACDVLFDAVVGFKLLKKDALLCFDDFLWHSGNRNPLQTPRQAVESFISCYRDKVFLFDSGQARQCWLVKTDE